MKRLALLLVVAASVGCAGTKWYNPDKGQRELYKDKADCAAKAGQAAGSTDPWGGVFRTTFMNCMYGEGWTN